MLPDFFHLRYWQIHVALEWEAMGLTICTILYVLYIAAGAAQDAAGIFDPLPEQCPWPGVSRRQGVIAPTTMSLRSYSLSYSMQ